MLQKDGVPGDDIPVGMLEAHFLGNDVPLEAHEQEEHQRRQRHHDQLVGPHAGLEHLREADGGPVELGGRVVHIRGGGLSCAAEEKGGGARAQSGCHKEKKKQKKARLLREREKKDRPLETRTEAEVGADMLTGNKTARHRRVIPARARTRCF